MDKIEFETQRVTARKDLLHILEEKQGPNIYEEIGKNPKTWIEELGMINWMLTGEGLSAGIGINFPPIGDPDFRKLGENVYLYRGEKGNLSGLWIKDSDNSKYNHLDENQRERYRWSNYKVGGRAVLTINKQFSILIEELLPENFEKIAKEAVKIKNGKTVKNQRSILIFDSENRGEKIKIYAKGASFNYSFYYSYSKPSYRLTSISSISKNTSESEMNKTLELRALDIKVPEIIGYYKSIGEEFFFAKQVKGKSPLKFINTHRKKIIEQDASMLAGLCLGGYMKQGFTDFDDKIFDGKDLFLIDVDECTDLYITQMLDYRKILLNPTDGGVERFRRFQREMFLQMLKDAVYEYKDNLTPDKPSQTWYIKSFFKRAGLGTPDEKTINNLLKFEKNYLTYGRQISLAMDTD